MEILAIVLIVISAAWPIFLFVVRDSIIARISKGIQHRFDQQIEELKSELRDSEGEIAALRNTVLVGSAGRQALLDKRRFEAVEKVWTAVNDLGQLKHFSAMMSVVNFKAVAKQVGDPKVQQFLSVIGSVAPDVQKLPKNIARDERPFLPELAWAYFAAYTTILYGSVARFSVLKSAVTDADKLLTNEITKKILKAALPHQSQFIDDQEPESYHYLLEEIEGHLLTELRKILDGKDADKIAAGRAKEIMDAVKGADEEKAQQNIPTTIKKPE